VPVEPAPCTTCRPEATTSDAALENAIPHAPSTPRLARSALCALLVVLSGCVRVYHPLDGMYDPHVVDPRMPNFDDVSLTVRCLRVDGYPSSEDNSRLCQNVGTLFENQGAEVTVVAYLGEESFGDDDDEAPVDVTTDLALELRSRQVSTRFGGLSVLLCVVSGTLIPRVSEEIFAVDITVRDGDGFLLVEDSMKGRLVNRFGLGTWLVNKLVNLGRDQEDRLNARNLSADLTSDLHRQLSQRLFDAKLQWRVQQEATVARRSAAGPGEGGSVEEPEPGGEEAE